MRCISARTTSSSAAEKTIKDTATVLSRYLDAIMIRTFAQADVEELAANASIPVSATSRRATASPPSW